MNQTLTTSFSCVLPMTNRACLSANKLIIPTHLDLGAMKLTEVKLDSVYVKSEGVDSNSALIHNLILTFRTPNAVVLSYSVEEVVANNLRISLALSKDEIKRLEEALLNNSEVLVLTAMTVSPDTVSITILYGIQVRTSYR